MKKVLSMMLAVLLLFTVSAFADGTDTVAWGEYGRVQMTEVTEWNDGMSYKVDGNPEGKWAVVVFTILDGGEYPTDALTLADEILRLDDYTVAKRAANGGVMNATTGEIKLTGTMAFFFDVPPDYDVSQAVVTVNGSPLTLP